MKYTLNISRALVALFVLTTFICCGSDDGENDQLKPQTETATEEEKETPAPADEYYVHYEFPVYGRCKYRDMDGELKDGPEPSGPFDSNPQHLDITIGPVKKGFKCYLTGTNWLNPTRKPTMRIQVSKNNGVLVDKASLTFTDTGGEYSLNYTIDF